MRACIYARTSRAEKRHTTTKLERQVAFCQELARRFNFTVAVEHVFTDVELTGDLLPSCWAAEDTLSRPAMAALIAAIEDEHVTRILVHRIEKLGTTSLVLDALRDFLLQHNVHVVVPREAAEDPDDPSARFALSVLRPCVQFDSDDEEERRSRLRARKQEEIDRLRIKIARIESEIAAL